MPAFSYSAVDNKGKKKKGVISAHSEREARRVIKDLQLTPISVEITKNLSSIRSRVKNKDIVIMTRQLSTLLEANTPIIDALKITADQLTNKYLVSIILNLREDVIQGKRLGVSMTKYPDIFNETYSSLVSAGDSSGNLDVIFNQLADYLEESAVTRQKVISALTYPLILVSFSIIVIIGLLYFVLPQVIGQFIKAGAELPFLTKALLGLSNNILIIIFIISLLLISLIVFYKNYISDSKKHIYLHKNILKLPVIGNFILISELERFSRTIGLILESGANLDTALEQSSKVFNNKCVLPNTFIQLISSGFKSGNLSKMFNKVSGFLKNDIDSKRSVFLSILEPLVIIFVGGFVMLIVLAILIPIMQMNTLSLG